MNSKRIGMTRTEFDAEQSARTPGPIESALHSIESLTAENAMLRRQRDALAASLEMIAAYCGMADTHGRQVLPPEIRTEMRMALTQHATALAKVGGAL
jgi:hypothetical protein